MRPRTATVLFVLPHAAVLALLPLVGRLRPRLGARLLPYGLLLAAAGLAVQAAAVSPGPLAGRACCSARGSPRARWRWTSG